MCYVHRRIYCNTYLLSLIVSIELPVTIPRSMFERELDYYGLAAGGGIDDHETLTKAAKSFGAPYQKAKANHDMFLLALECYYQFTKHILEHPESAEAKVVIDSSHKLHNKTVSRLSGEDKKLLNGFLGKHFGLKCVYLDGHEFWVSECL